MTAFPQEPRYFEGRVVLKSVQEQLKALILPVRLSPPPDRHRKEEARAMTPFVNAVQRAEEKIRELFPKTILQKNDFLSERYDCEILLKREDLTPVRSYKIRGAYSFIQKAIATQSSAQSIPRFVCASAGNHAQGFAYACAFFECRGTVFMPVTTPQQKIMKTKTFGKDFIDIELVGDIFDESYGAAQNFCDSNHALMVPPFDHEDIITGQATVAQEIIEECNAPDLVIMPVGGGGLAAGVVRYFQKKAPTTDLIFVEPAGAPSLKESLRQGRRVRLPFVDNFVDGAAVAELGRHNYEALRDLAPQQVIDVPEDRLCVTLEEFLTVEGIVLEPAGALALDALKDLSPEELQGKRVVCIVSGGNFDFERLPEVKERALKHTSLKKYFILRMPQRPGALKDFLFLLGPDDDITRFEYLKKSARDFGSILIGIQTTRPENFDFLTQKFEKGGLRYQDITDNAILANLII